MFRLKAVKVFRKTLDFRCLTLFWICLWRSLIYQTVMFYLLTNSCCNICQLYILNVCYIWLYTFDVSHNKNGSAKINISLKSPCFFFSLFCFLIYFCYYYFLFLGLSLSIIVIILLLFYWFYIIIKSLLIRVSYLLDFDTIGAI